MTNSPHDAAGHQASAVLDGRGLYRSIAFLTIFAMLFGGLLMMAPAPASAQSTATTTAALNLRSGPSLDNSIVTVMPYGSTVSVTGSAEAGFYPVSYGGTSGYAYGDYLAFGGSGSTSGGATGTAYVIDGALNLRAGPSLGHTVLTVMPNGAAVSLTGEAANGFLGVTYNGTSGYAYGDYLNTSGGAGAPPPAPSNPVASDGATGPAWVTAGLNFRTGPSLGDSVIAVMPTGAEVTLTGESANGFLGVTYNGRSGWAYGEFLTTSGGSVTPVPAPSTPSSGIATDGRTGTAYVTGGALNLRTGPSLSDPVLTVMANASQLTLTGEYANGFLGVTYNGTPGFAHGDYITDTAPGGTADTGADPKVSGPAPAPSNPGSGDVAVGDTVVSNGYVTSWGVNLRRGPSTSYGVITTMTTNEPVQIMGDPRDGFLPVQYYGFKGWASADFIAYGNAPAASGTEDIVAIIYAAADAYGQPRADMLRVARCESVLDPNALNPISNASGLFQFLPGTWATTPFADQDIFDAEANANAAAWMWSVGRRNEWSCQ